MLSLALRMADAAAHRLPAAVAYRLADLAGDAWHRFAPSRRALVSANLARVSRATGRPARGAALRRLVRQAFRAHARYYMELLRFRMYTADRIREQVTVEDWRAREPELRRGATVVALPHVGNFEPLGTFFAVHGLAATAPVEEIRPRELFDFLLARRAGGPQAVNVVPLARARRPMVEALRRGEIVALVADRDLTGDGVPVELFGHATTLPAGPAALAVLSGARLMTARVLRTAPDRFHARGEWLPWEASGDRRADIEQLTREIGRRFEAAIGEAPEQWWAAFQPIWPDLRGKAP